MALFKALHTFIIIAVLLAVSCCNAFVQVAPTLTRSRLKAVSPKIHQSARSASYPSQRFVYRATSQFVSDEGDESSGKFGARKWVRKSCHNLALRTRAIMKSILRWQKKSRRNIVLAASMALAAAFVSSEQIDQYCQPAVQPSPTEVVQMASSTQTQTPNLPVARTQAVSRGGGDSVRLQNNKKEKVDNAAQQTGRTIQQAITELGDYMNGPKSDTLLLLLATALITPVCKRFGTSPILGFLASGMLLGPNGWGLISGIHTTETLAELGIVFFLFEMGIELSFERLLSMRKDVFGLGFSQFVSTAVAIAAAGRMFGLPANALVVLGGGLALSSSAFVLQLLKDKDQLATRFGKASFGVLLFQDLAVVPLLVVTPILAGGGGGLASALSSATIKAAMALGSIAFAGRVILNPLFKTVAQSQSQEAFLGVVLLTVLSMSFMTEGLGLSNTLGAFLAGVLLSETKYRYQIEADIAPFRGILLGLFFVTVGFEIDLHLIASKFPQVAGIVMGIIAIKGLTITLLSLAFGLSLSTSQQTGLILSQGGEFAFVAFGLARGLGILDPATTKLLLTSVSLTMAVTPALAGIGGKIAKRLEEESDFTHYLGQDRDANEIKESDGFAVVVGYGVVGKVVCDLLDQKLIKYVGIEIDPNKAIEARNKGLPVFYGDVGRPEVAEAFNVGKANAVILCIADKEQTNRAVISLRRMYPDLKIFCRAKNADHAERLQSTLDVAAMVPVLPEDNLLLTLPFAGAVLKSLGAAPEEVNSLLEGKRKELLMGRGLTKNEEELALAQLGISVEEKPKKKKKAVVVDVVPEEEKEEEEEKDSTGEKPEAGISRTAEAAAAVVEERIEKSPMVAKVIEEACPDTAKVREKTDDESSKVAFELDSGIAPVLEVESVVTSDSSAESDSNGIVSTDATSEAESQEVDSPLSPL